MAPLDQTARRHLSRRPARRSPTPCAAPPAGRSWDRGVQMTEVLLLVVAVLLTFVCGVFVAAEFSLTTVERGELERAARDGERGAAAALAGVRTLTVQLSGAQLGITASGLIIGMLAESSVAKLLRGPLRAAGLPRSGASSLALVLGTAVSTMALMVIGEL